MIRERCEKCGESYPAGAPHECPLAAPPKPRPENDNHDDQAPPPDAPPGHFDEKAWRKSYMREDMRRKRERQRREKEQGQTEPEGLAC